jgi:hypothetical protein
VWSFPRCRKEFRGDHAADGQVIEPEAGVCDDEPRQQEEEIDRDIAVADDLLERIVECGGRFQAGVRCG